MNPQLEPLIRTMLVADEGRRSKPYVDTVGKVTIGIGRNLTDVGLSQDEVELLYSNDLARALTCAKLCVSSFDALTVPRQAVLVDMAFNLGNRLLGFTHFLLAVQQGRYNDAAQEMINSKWAAQVGARATRLTAMMKSG